MGGWRIEDGWMMNGGWINRECMDRWVADGWMWMRDRWRMDG